MLMQNIAQNKHNGVGDNLPVSSDKLIAMLSIAIASDIDIDTTYY